MPQVLHVLPPDATLSCPGLAEWIDLGRSFIPLVASTAPGLRWGVTPQTPLPAPQSWWQRTRSRYWPGAEDPWRDCLDGLAVGLVHLHTLSGVDDLLQATARLDVPVVLSWPADGPASFDFSQVSHVLAASPPQADWLRQLGCYPDAVRVSPPPVRPPDAGLGQRAGRISGPAFRWVTTLAARELETLPTLLEAFALFEAGREVASHLTVLVSGGDRPAAEFAVAAKGLSAQVSILVADDDATVRRALREAHFGVFALGAARSERGEGLSWGAWQAAASGMPLVLGQAARLDGFADHQHALLSHASPEALAQRMVFLASRPYIWPVLGPAAMRLATGRLAYERACDIPFEVYRQVLQASGHQPAFLRERMAQRVG